ncbi:hypothetical protein [Saccharopolyspora phatthalungensis]|uniref:Uncharacterized protein n=1 Tax=Saccharopolyspora phatthalungensis TaxID=664693 RepID=A0A840Q4I9_9PSEU|nr:hypothetical protein [Saccharopolyspora phatthalungensis]MBB5154897.1 hypothetical protein [Saccharopolyspora phatthalungensis]
MLSAKRVIAATALGLPLVLGAPGMALADGGHGEHGKKAHKEVQDQDIKQDEDASIKQSNENKPVQYLFNVGKGDQNAVSWNKQDNDADIDQTEAAWQEQED